MCQRRTGMPRARAPATTARSSGVAPGRSRASMLAPRAIAHCTTDTWPAWPAVRKRGGGKWRARRGTGAQGAGHPRRTGVVQDGAPVDVVDHAEEGGRRGGPRGAALCCATGARGRRGCSSKAGEGINVSSRGGLDRGGREGRRARRASAAAPGVCMRRRGRGGGGGRSSSDSSSGRGGGRRHHVVALGAPRPPAVGVAGAGAEGIRRRRREADDARGAVRSADRAARAAAASRGVGRRRSRDRGVDPADRPLGAVLHLELRQRLASRRQGRRLPVQEDSVVRHAVARGRQRGG